MTSRRKKFAGKRFAAVDHEVLDHPAFLALSARGKALVWLLLRRFNGKNNGTIPASARDIQSWARCGWRQIFPTIREVEATSLALRTTVGVYRPGTPQASEWRLTFLPVGDTPATHDYRRQETQPAMRKIKRRSHSGSGAVPTVEAEPAEKSDTSPAKTAVSVPTVEAESQIVRSQGGITCKLPGRGSFGGAPVGGLVVGSSVPVDLPPEAGPKTAAPPDPAAAAPGSEVARHDAHVRTMRAWAVEGKSPPGLGARLRHWREAGRGWSRAKLATATGIKAATLAAMEAGRQHVRPDAYRAIVTALAVDPLQVNGLMAPLELASKLAAAPKHRARKPADPDRQTELRRRLAAALADRPSRKVREIVARNAGLNPATMFAFLAGRPAHGSTLAEFERFLDAAPAGRS